MKVSLWQARMDWYFAGVSLEIGVFIKRQNLKSIKNGNYESYRPFEKDVVQYAIFANEKAYFYYTKKMCLLSTKLVVENLIIASSKCGKIQVSLNVFEV